MRVIKYEKEEWKKYSENAHLICFKENRSESMDRIDFALFGVSSSGVPCGYITCRELDSETLYWAFGGAFPSVKGTALSYRCYVDFVEYCKPNYKRILTFIENENVVMIKMAHKIGFRIFGIRNTKEQILLEHLLEF